LEAPFPKTGRRAYAAPAVFTSAPSNGEGLMAKKKSGGTSIGLILTLIFFILATFITGTVAYFGYSEQDQFKKSAEDAKKQQKTAEDQMREARVRTLVYRIAIGAADDADRVLLVSELDALRPQIKEEYDRFLVALDNENVPMVPSPSDKGKMVRASAWPLLTADAKAKTEGRTTQDIASDPDVRPVMTLPEMLRVFKTAAEKARNEKNDAVTALAAANKRAAESNVDKETEKRVFDSKLQELQQQQKDKFGKLDVDFGALVAKHANDAKKYIDRAEELGKADNLKADEIAKLNNKIADLLDKLKKFEDQASSTSRLNAQTVEFLNMEERKGIIVRKEEGGFVIINVGSSKKVKPQITFLVVDATVSWLALLEKEESLKKNSYRQDRQPFEDNPYVKAGIEVVEVLDAETSRAKVIFENEPIRNPIQPRDQIFNMAWQPDEEIRVAFAGIIDLDGDGLDNNEDFLRMLERQGVIVDEYLKLKPLEFVKRDGKGMTLRTKYLIIAPDPKLDSLPTDRDTPQTLQIKATIEKMSEIKARARELGVQMIEARKFLALIGFKLPKNPVPPAYGAGHYIDQSGAAPAPEPKKGGM
jgi:hypothetical protein